MKYNTFIIAEVGNSHSGSYQYAKKAISLAKKAGADAVKFQYINPAKLVHPNLKPYVNDKKFKTQLEKLKKITLTLNDFKKLSKHAKKNRIKFGLSIFDISAVTEVKKIVDFYKIASGDIKFKKLINKVISTKKRVIISTGLSEIKEVFKKNFKKNISILHCVSKYPSKSEDLGMKNIIDLKKRYKKNIIGFSDHTQNYLSCLCATSLGANIIEKHFMINYEDKHKPDYNVSIDYHDFKKMVTAIREIEKMLNYKKRIPSKNKLIMQRSWYATNDIKKNTLLNEKNCDFLRPYSNNGIDLNFVKKSISKKKIKKFELITKNNTY